jgi:predicted esterase
MRRLLIFLAAIVLLAPVGADAAKPQVVAGAAHKAGDRVKGWFAVEAPGPNRSQRARVAISLGDGHTALAIGRVAVPSLAPGARRRARFAAKLPASLASDHWRIRACLPRQCLRLGEFTISAGAGESPPPPSGPRGERAPAPGGGPPATPSSPISTIPGAPLLYVPGEPFEVSSGAVPYWAFVPDSYKPDNLTPAPLLVWLHGCGGESSGDVWVVDPGAGEEPQDWLTIAVGGREGECWTPSTDEAKVMAALADMETHFNVDRDRVILGGYSSGGDLAYRTGFRHSSTFEGLLIENSSPFRDTESSPAESLAAATTKLPIVHLAHTGDTTYPLTGVRKEVGEVKAAGFPIELIERPGTHSDSHTDSDLIEYLLPHIDGGWPG